MIDSPILQKQYDLVMKSEKLSPEIKAIFKQGWERGQRDKKGDAQCQSAKPVTE